MRRGTWRHMVGVRRGPEPTPAAVHNRATDRSSDAQPTRLRRVERLEQACRLGLAEARHSPWRRSPRAIVAVVGDRADDHPAPHRRDLPHGPGGIQQQIEEDLLELEIRSPITRARSRGSTSRRVASSSEARSKRRALGRGVAWRPIGCDHRFFKWRSLLTAGWSDVAKRLSTTSIQGGTDPYQSRVDAFSSRN
jgi:hypothetical protein